MNLADFLIVRQAALRDGVSSQQATTDAILAAAMRRPLGLLLGLFLARNQAANNPPSIVRLGTKADLTVSNTATVGTSATLSVQVTADTATPNPPVPSGMVSFFDGDILIGTALLDAGSAEFETQRLSFGDHLFLAIYAGDSTYAPSQSDPVGITLK
jgi:hypothetical protein